MKFPSFTTINLSKTGMAALIFALCLLCSFGAAASTKDRNRRGGVDIRIKNFGQVDERLYRGAQPDREDFDALAQLGVKTVIDLREDAPGYEPAAVEAAGMRYVNIPMRDKSMPRDAQTAQFLKMIENPANGPYFVHCAGGRHRTGVMVAAYRINHYNWSIDQAYDEMKAYDFSTSWGHGDYKDYIYRYYSDYKAMHRANDSTNSTVGRR